MRLPNNKNIPANKAAISITATLYDRRALDCTIDKPLVNSLNNLTFLASSSPKVRETLVGDGGISRLVDILNECFLGTEDNDESGNESLDIEVELNSAEAYKLGKSYSNFQNVFFEYLSGMLKEVSTLASKDEVSQLDKSESVSKLISINESLSRSIKIFMDYLNNYKAKRELKKVKNRADKKVLVAWKWTLTLQVLVLCGTRGNERIRKKIVKSGIIPIVATVLDNYLLVKSGKIKLNSATKSPSVDDQSDLLFAEPNINEISNESFDRSFNEVINSIYVIVSSLDGSAVSNRNVSIHEIQEQVQLFVQRTNNGGRSLVPPQQFSSLAGVLLETLKMLSRMSLQQREIRHARRVNGGDTMGHNNDSNIRLLRSIKANINIISLLIRGLANNMQEINQNLNVYNNFSNNHVNVSSMNSMNDDPPESANVPTSNSQTTSESILNSGVTGQVNPFDQRLDTTTSNGITNMAQNISTGLTILGQAMANTQQPANFEVNNQEPPNTFESRTAVTVQKFNRALREILFDDFSNSTQDLISLNSIVQSDDNGRPMYWSVSTKDNALMFSLNGEGKIVIDCSLAADKHYPLIPDILAICKEFSKQDSNSQGATGLDRYSGKYIINWKASDCNESPVDHPEYHTLLAHMFKNLFFRDSNGDFCTNKDLPADLLSPNNNRASPEHDIIINNTDSTNNSQSIEAASRGNNADVDNTPFIESPTNANVNNDAQNALDMNLVQPPREFYKGKIVPADDDIIWVLQLLAFVSKYTHMKDVLQFTYIVPKLSLREYPNAIADMKSNGANVTEFFRDKRVDLEFIGKQIVENHFKRGWGKSGAEFYMLNEKMGTDLSDLPFLFPNGASTSSLFRPRTSDFAESVHGSLENNINILTDNDGVFRADIDSLFVQQGINVRDNDVIVTEDAENIKESIEDKLFSLKINCDLEKFNENVKLLQKTNREDIAELFYLINKYKEMISNPILNRKDITKPLNKMLPSDDENGSSDESSGDDMESVEFGSNYNSNTRLVQPISEPDEGDVTLGAMNEIQPLSRSEIERFGLKYGSELDSSSRFDMIPPFGSEPDKESDELNSISDDDNNIDLRNHSDEVNSAAINFKVDKSILSYQINKKFEKILKINSALTYKMKKVKYYEKKRAELQKKWNYEDYDFDDSDYSSILKAPDTNNSHSINSVGQQLSAYQRLGENFIHLPLNYCKPPIIASSIENFHKDLPSISYLNFFPSNQQEQDAFKCGKSTIMSKHDLDYSIIPLDYLNVFGLVERFSNDIFPTEFTHWSGVIMRNSCRKDEQKGGIRQCGNTTCGKWETDKRFSKCKRCRRAKYCSRDCQFKAWEYHKYWCQPASSSSSSNSANTNGDGSSSSRHRHRHHHNHHHRTSRHGENDATENSGQAGIQNGGTQSLNMPGNQNNGDTNTF
ncbi:Mub1 protein [Saccharomycopsis crataegensis]|uniref:Mub1 protein n=1 Tax=Saccharomycopsis crataegensis TaxID=43959 RepID=A0AAV5QV55_9ASCO|nr:Mub1 protein [Saccharomycopsis crataegensis]